MKRAPFVSVIIPTFNRGQLIPLTLDSFLAQTYPEGQFEIIVANNNSTDNTEEVIAEYAARHRGIKSVHERRQGVHYARNSAAKVARGEILYFTDDDMIADRSLLEEIVKVFDLDPLIGSVTGKIIGKFETPPPHWVKKDLINANLSLTEEDKPEDLIISRDDLAYSCHEAIRKDVFFQCGGFNPENTAGTWIGDGETGLGIKLKRADFKFAYTSRSITYHFIPQSRMTFRYLIERVGNQGNCDSYTEYRTHKVKDEIVPRMVKRNTCGFVRMLGITIIEIVRGKKSWRIIAALLVYLCRRNIFDIRLYRDDKFRKFAEMDDWLNDDVSS